MISSNKYPHQTQQDNENAEYRRANIQKININHERYGAYRKAQP
jgi:hypothetical protein